jgi:hypothetical protein
MPSCNWVQALLASALHDVDSYGGGGPMVLLLTLLTFVSFCFAVNLDGSTAWTIQIVRWIYNISQSILIVFTLF